jgi:hypothetical protein
VCEVRERSDALQQDDGCTEEASNIWTLDETIEIEVNAGIV